MTGADFAEDQPAGRMNALRPSGPVERATPRRY
jgi:hypothetical protein